MSFSPGGGGGSSLAGDSDVTLSDLQDSQFLVFDTTTNKWANKGLDQVGAQLPTATEAEPFLTAAAGDQDITSDGSYFYWGHNNGNGVNGSIYKLNPNDGSVVATFTGPTHCASIDYRANRDTLLACSGNNGDPPIVWEINKTSGSKLRTWDFSGVDYGEGGYVVWNDSDASGNGIYLYTNAPGSVDDFKIRRFTINDDGTYVDGGLVLTAANLGISQGMCCRDGKVYYLTDSLQDNTTNIRQVTRYSPAADGMLERDRTWGFIVSGESEGLTFHNGQLYFGMYGSHRIYRAPFQPWHDTLLTQNLVVCGPAGINNSERVVVVRNTNGSHTGVGVDGAAGHDAYYSFSQDGASMWDIRNDASSSNTLQIRTQQDNVVRMELDRAGSISGDNFSAVSGMAITAAGKGITLTSPNGTEYLLTVSDTGQPVLTAL